MGEAPADISATLAEIGTIHFVYMWHTSDPESLTLWPAASSGPSSGTAASAL